MSEGQAEKKGKTVMVNGVVGGGLVVSELRAILRCRPKLEHLRVVLCSTVTENRVFGLKLTLTYPAGIWTHLR